MNAKHKIINETRAPTSYVIPTHSRAGLGIDGVHPQPARTHPY